jgi:hypothetical protein
MALWDVLPDDEREQWTLEPFVGVGPLRFGMSPDEASAALGGIKPGVQWHKSSFSASTYDYGVTPYYKSEQNLPTFRAQKRPPFPSGWWHASSGPVTGCSHARSFLPADAMDDIYHQLPAEAWQNQELVRPDGPLDGDKRNFQ